MALCLSACTVSARGVETTVPTEPNEQVRYEGTVARGDRLPPPQVQLQQVAVITLRTTGDRVRVLLAPTWYLEQHGFGIDEDELVVVRGRQVLEDGEPSVLASEIQRGSRTLRLRDENGEPLWQQQPAPAPAPDTSE